MIKPKVMIVGAGAGQVPIIKCCQKHGLFTVVISPFGPYPGISIADKHINEDIFNKEALVKIGREESIDYVVSDQSDYAVPIVAYISEKLNIPGNKLSIAQIYTFKSNFRDFCHKNEIPAPKSTEISDINELEDKINSLKLPVIVKPGDSQGSRGVEKVNNILQLKDAINKAFKFSRNGNVIVEEYFEGKEIVCEGFVIDGEYFNVAFGDREYFTLPDLFIPSKTIFPSSVNEKVKQNIIANETKMASLLKPTFGIVHSEYIINANGNFIVIESALRGGGVYIASHLVPLTTGVDLTEVLFYSMIGEKEVAKKLLKPRHLGTAEYLCFYLKEGIVNSIDGLDKIKMNSCVKIAEIDNIHVGDKIGCFEHKGMRNGPFVIAANNLQEIIPVETEIKDNLCIKVNNKNGIIWE